MGFRYFCMSIILLTEKYPDTISVAMLTERFGSYGWAWQLHLKHSFYGIKKNPWSTGSLQHESEHDIFHVDMTWHLTWWCVYSLTWWHEPHQIMDIVLVVMHHQFPVLMEEAISGLACQQQLHVLGKYVRL